MKIIHLLHELESQSGMFESFVVSKYVPELINAYPYLRVERANFLSPDGMVTAAHMADAPPPPAYSAILETRIDDQDLARFQRDLRDRSLHVRLDEISEGKLDRKQTRLLAVDEHLTPSADIGPTAATPDDGRMIKQVVNLRKSAAMTTGAFVDYYESKHAPLTVRTLPIFSKYARNFVIDDDDLQNSLNPEGNIKHEFDVTTHIWFKDAAARENFAEAFADPDVGAMFAEDSDKLFESGSMQMFLVRETIF